MITIGRNYIINSSDRGASLTGAVSRRDRQKMASVVSRANERRQQVKAWTNANSLGYGGFGVSQTSTTINTPQLLLDGILIADPRIKRRIFRDIYYHDAISGGAVDVYSTLPFSDFHLEGTKDREIIDTFHRSVEKLHTRTLLPSASRDYLTLGSFIGTASFDEKEKIFTSVMPQNIDQCVMTQVPLWGLDPIIDLTLPKMLLSMFANDQGDPRVRQIIKKLPPNIQTRLADGKIPLDPATTIFLPRRTLTSDTLGTSLYERILPVHLMEKALFRGTIDLAYRRQAPLLHITVGGDDDWIATNSDLDSIRDMFLQGDMDPAGAIIVTRTGISPNEVRQPSDFWRVDTMFDFSAAIKYRALGISESIITGEATLSSLDASLSVMIDNIRYYRATIEREFFYNKIFPVISAANDFRLDTADHRVIANAYENYRQYGALSSIRRKPSGEYMAVCADSRFPLSNLDLDAENLVIPKIVWHKHLNPEGDVAYMEILSNLQTQGIPIPLAMFAAAGGVSLSDIVDAMPQELNIRKKIAMFQERLQEFAPQQTDQDGQYQSQAKALASVLETVSRNGVGNPRHREPAPGVLTYDKNGKPRRLTVKGQKTVEERFRKKVAEALARNADNRNRKIKNARSRLDKKTFVSNVYGVL